MKWGQAFQDEVVHQDVSYALTDSRLSGITVWQFSDIKADDAVQTVSGMQASMFLPSQLRVAHVVVAHATVVRSMRLCAAPSVA